MEIQQIHPIVTVIIPTFNRAKKIQRTLNSVWNQTYKSFHVIIVDDGSTDGTMTQVCKDNRERNFTYLKLPTNSGPSKARNIGFSRVTSPYAAFLDSDDIWDPSFLAKMVSALDKDKRTGLVYCDTNVYDSKKNHYHTFLFEPFSYNILIQSTGKIATGAFLFRTEYARQIAPMREDIWRGEDFEWQLRFGELFDFKRYPEMLHEYFRDVDGLIMSTTNSQRVKYSIGEIQKTKEAIYKRMARKQVKG